MEISEQLLPVKQVSNVQLHIPLSNTATGDVCLSSSHLMFMSNDSVDILQILISNIDAVDRNPPPSTDVIHLKTKNLKRYKFVFPDSDTAAAIATSLSSLCNIETVTALYPFTYRANFDVIEDGWEAFLPESEFARAFKMKEYCRLSVVNKDFAVCPSYPQFTVVPKAVSDETIAKAATFRQGSRYPVLSYFHNSTSTCLLRSAQPLVGANNRRCKEDEQLLNAILVSPQQRGYILDTRPPSIIRQQQSKGGGIEQDVYYPQWRRLGQIIQLPVTFHESYIKLIQAVSDDSLTSEKWLCLLDNSNWMTNIKEMITCACVVAQCLDREGASVLVHGSEGLDITLLISSLVQVILDQDCHTIRGFEALIDREWIQAGHPFQERCFKSAFSSAKNKFIAPTFLYFLDCTWQILSQYGGSFEFNEQFLVTLFEHCYSSNYGTFLCNNEKERKEMKLASRTVSLWSYINRPEVIETFLNPLYIPNKNPLWPSVAPQSLRLWTNLYLGNLSNNPSQKLMNEEFKQIKNEQKEVKLLALKLRRTLAALQGEALQAGLLTVQPTSP